MTAVPEDARDRLVLFEHLLGETPRYTRDELEAASGLGEDARRFWGALGFPDPPPGEPVFGDRDLEMLRMLERLLQFDFVERDVALQMTRVIGSSMVRIAATQIETFEARAIDLGEPDESRAEEFGLLLSTMPRILEYAWRRHLVAMARRRILSDDGGQRAAAVGFADLVGFTAMSQQLTDIELAAVVDRFEVLAYDTVAALGGRVVKMIGDEVMFTVEDASRAVDIALSLAEAYHDDESLSDVRVGVAVGPVLERDGDLFGPTVNVASRIVGIAFAASVVVSDEVHEALAEAEGLLWKPLRTRYLKDIGRVRLWAVRRADDTFEREGTRERAWRRRGTVRDRLAELAERLPPAAPPPPPPPPLPPGLPPPPPPPGPGP